MWDRNHAITHSGAWGTGLLIAASALGVAGALWKLLGIAWVAFAAMAGGALLGARSNEREAAAKLVWAYGLCAGAMVTSTTMFLVPAAIGHHGNWGGFGLAAGIVAGFALHTAGHQATHMRLPWDPTLTQLTTHSLGAGLVIGLVYASMPTLGPLLGLAIISHKGPAGYAASRRRARCGEPTSSILLSAAAVGIAALPMGMLPLHGYSASNALVFGIAAGIFLHVAMDFLPRCEAGSEIQDAAGVYESDHHSLDRLRIHSVASTAIGCLVVLAAWLILRL